MKYAKSQCILIQLRPRAHLITLRLAPSSSRRSLDSMRHIIVDVCVSVTTRMSIVVGDARPGREIENVFSLGRTNTACELSWTTAAAREVST